MNDAFEHLKRSAQDAVKAANNLEVLETLRTEYLGRKGKMAELMKQLPQLADDARKEAGKLANETKSAIEAVFIDAAHVLNNLENSTRREAEWIDITAPGIAPEIGHTHLVTQTFEEILFIFRRLGFVRTRHPEVDWDWYVFESLNQPKDHPARDEQETFFVADPLDPMRIMEGNRGKVVLTTQTSNGQVREMEKGRLPIRMISIGKAYRRQIDISHVPMFHQFEGLVVDKGVTIADLKGTLDFFAKNYFGPDRTTRLRPHHFRFTEPSFEIDISCDVCKGTGTVATGSCRLCKEGWLELGGAGMVHPNVLKAGGLDPEVYSGFAFGWGVERTMMMKAGINIDDMRILYKNDLRFLEQF